MDKFTGICRWIVDKSVNFAMDRRFEFVTPECLLFVGLLNQPQFCDAIVGCDGNLNMLKSDLSDFLDGQMTVPDDVDYEIELSVQFLDMLNEAKDRAFSSECDLIDITHVISALLHLDDSFASYALAKCLGSATEADFMSCVIDAFGDESDNVESDDMDDDEADDSQSADSSAEWRKYVVCLNDTLDQHNPLIGRTAELDRTIQVLCRCDKNNPLHVGEPGVGKTSLVYGLTRRIVDGQVPDRLIGAKVYSLDLGGLLAGTQFRGDFEKRIKMIMDGVAEEGNAIVYIDEIHNLVGAGQTGEGSMDASNMLKPHLESGNIRFIGSTTYKEYNRYFTKSGGMVRRFQLIDILEPGRDEAVQILEGLRDKYQQFHNVTYSPDSMAYAVDMSIKYVNDRHLPDKAIDLIDEAGAYREMHPSDDNVVDTDLIADVLAKVCKIDKASLTVDDNSDIENLEQRIAGQIFGQPLAVQQVADAVLMGRAGLLDDEKPVASLLFVGPTGVGKTEVTRVLASELGLPLVRFDMSEYAEKHTVAKLIGSPAGYVGYEDGGLLTDAIRKTPNCVLLLDEIEKAHSDIYNILLQVMDYAKLTDNKGQKADFRHVILVMTSNAGAQYASQASVGFGSRVSAGDAMMAQVKKTFKPEFLNRLSGTVIFNDMDIDMAARILDKKIGLLADRLAARSVLFSVSQPAKQRLLNLGFSPKYGAREMDRVIRQQVNPLLMRQMLFDRLKNGGKAVLDFRDDVFVVDVL